MFYGFKLAAVLWAYYGLTLGMKAGAWGYFAPEISEDLSLSATEIGSVAGIVFAGTAVFMPIAGFYIQRFGCRASMVLGVFIGAAGLLVTAYSNFFWQFAVGGVLLAASTSFSGIVPIQTLTTMWFDKYRARAMALIFTGTPVWGAASYPTYDYLLTFLTWRESIAVLTVIFPIGLLLILAFVRNAPADMGLAVDGLGRNGEDNSEKPAEQAAAPISESAWTTRTALMSPLFAAITLAVVICTLPYLYLVTFGRFTLEAQGVQTGVVVAALASLTFATLFGRLLASLADFLDARLLVLGALVCNVVGIAIIYTVTEPILIYASVFLMGLSFGLSFLLAPILLARYFGRSVFSVVEGVRVALVVGINAGLTPLFGYVVDVSGSYLLPLAVMLGINIISILFMLPMVLQRRSAAKPIGQE